MRLLLLFISVISANTLAFGQTSDRCLEDATNRQLVNELERRLYGGSEETGAIANFFCDSNGYFNLSLINQDGMEQTDRLYIGSTSRCDETTAELRAVRDVRSLKIVAVCDSSAYLYRYTLTAEGVINQLDRRYIGSVSTCARERSNINAEASLK